MKDWESMPESPERWEAWADSVHADLVAAGLDELAAAFAEQPLWIAVDERLLEAARNRASTCNPAPARPTDPKLTRILDRAAAIKAEPKTGQPERPRQMAMGGKF